MKVSQPCYQAPFGNLCTFYHCSKGRFQSQPRAKWTSLNLLRSTWQVHGHKVQLEKREQTYICLFTYMLRIAYILYCRHGNGMSFFEWKFKKQQQGRVEASSRISVTMTENLIFYLIDRQ